MAAVKLTETHQEYLESVLAAFERRGIDYVCLRGFHEYPDRLVGSDLDLFVAPGEYADAIEVCDRSGLGPTGSRVGNAVALVSEGINQPGAAAILLLDSPDDFLAHIQKRLFPTSQNVEHVVGQSFGDDVQIHLVNHLAYTSPLSGEKIRVDPSVEAAMLDRRRRREAMYVPAPPDELAHLVCRGVFDYDGTFPDYYRARCDQLVETLLADGDQRAFESLLETIFYGASGLVYDHVVEGAYDDIHDALVRFADY